MFLQNSHNIMNMIVASAWIFFLFSFSLKQGSIIFKAKVQPGCSYKIAFIKKGKMQEPRIGSELFVVAIGTES